MDELGLGEGQQAIVQLGEGREVASTLRCEFARDIDHRLSCLGRVGPEVEGELGADDVEVDIVIRSWHWLMKSRAMLLVQVYFFAMSSTMARE